MDTAATMCRGSTLPPPASRSVQLARMCRASQLRRRDEAGSAGDAWAATSALAPAALAPYSSGGCASIASLDHNLGDGPRRPDEVLAAVLQYLGQLVARHGFGQ